MIAIGLCIDRAYLIPGLVTLVSFAECHPPAVVGDIAIRLLSTDITPTEAQTFHSVVRRLGFGSFQYKRISLSGSVPIVHGDYISSATYLRFAFDQTFVDRPYLLYMDSDVLVTGDMTAPFNTLYPGAIGAVRDEINHTVGIGPALPGLVAKYPEYNGQPYFNAGILWFAASELSAASAGSMRAIRRRREHIHFNDQDALNIWFLESDSRVELSSQFNRFELGRFLEHSDWLTGVVRVARHDSEAHLLHFVGPDKPWLRKCPSVAGVKSYSRVLRRARATICRTRDATMELPT